MNNFYKGIAACMISALLCNTVFMPNIVLAEEKAENQDIRARVNSIINPMTLEVGSIPKGNAYIPKDTVINVELLEELTSKTSRVGDDVKLKTLDNIIINDVIVVPTGSVVNGKVTKCTSSGL